MKNLISNKILKNKIQCNYCKEILISHYQHDFKMCKCGKTGIDGGNEFLKRCGTGYTETSIIDDGSFELQREYCEWGSNYDKEHNLLKETLFRPVKDLETEHIYKILETQILTKFWVRLFWDELRHREELILESYEQ